MTITISASGIALDGPLVAGEKVAVSVSGLSIAAEDKPTLALLARFPDALLASVELAEDAQTPGTWTGELDTATKQTALFFATARADERRDAALELVAGRVSLARLTVPMANSALCPKPDGSPFASPVYIPVPGPPGQGGDPYDQAPEMDGEESAGTSDKYSRGDHRHPTDTTRQAVIEDLAAIRSGAAAGATAVQPAALSAYRTAEAQDAIDGAQNTAIAAKYTKPSGGIPASDLATGVIPSVPSLPISIANGGTGATNKNTALANLGAVKKSGDTMTGDLEVQRRSGSYTGGTVSVRSVPGEVGEALVKVAAPDGAELYLDAASGYNPSIAVKRAGGELKEIEVPNNAGTLALQEGLASAFSPSSTYAVGYYCTHEGLLYKCTTAVSTAGAWNAANWSAVAVTDEMGADTPLPFDAECEYVTAAAGVYILPEIVNVSADFAVEMSIRLPSSGVSSTNNFLCGNWRGSAATSSQITTPNATSLQFMNFNGTTKNLSISAVLGDFATVAMRGSRFSVESETDSVAPANTITFPIDFCIGGCSLADGTVDDGNTTFDIQTFKYWSNGSLARDMVPVRVGTVGYLYDKVSGRLFGSAVGSIPLVPGPDKAQPTITTPGRIVELTPAIRYAFASPTPSVSGTSATVACEDRAINDFTVATGITSLTITPPAAVTGRARDFFCRVTLTDSSLPTVTLSGATIDIGATDVAGMTQGVNLLMFTEISSGHWIASRRSA